MDKMVKERKKYNGIIIKVLNESYGLSSDFIRKSLRGERTSSMSMKIIKDYDVILNKIDAVINDYKIKK